METSDKTMPKQPRGFAAMDKEKQRAIARKGGESVPPEERSFSKDHELAAEAGRKGGEASGESRREKKLHQQHVQQEQEQPRQEGPPAEQEH